MIRPLIVTVVLIPITLIVLPFEALYALARKLLIGGPFYVEISATILLFIGRAWIYRRRP